MFNDRFYKQVDGVSMGSPLGPVLANIFLCHNEVRWLKECPKQFKPIYYKRYVDDIFTLFTSKEQVKKFDKYIGSRHNKIKFKFDIESDSQIPFLDVLITKGQQFSTSVFHKPTFSGLYTNFFSYIDLTYKKGLLNTLLFCSFNICSNLHCFHDEVEKLEEYG